MKFSIGLKIAFGFFVVLFLLSAMGYFAYYSLNKNSFHTNKITEEIRKQILAGNLRFTVARTLMASNDYIISGDNKYINDFQNINATLNKYLSDFAQINLSQNEEDLFNEIKTDIDSIRSISQNIFTLNQPFVPDNVIQLMETIDYEYGERINKNTTRIFDGIADRIANLLNENEKLKSQQSKVIFNIISVGFLFSLVIILLTIHRITKPIKKLEKAASQIANGDYSIRLKVNTKDEISSLANSFSAMANSIEESYNKLMENKSFLETIYSTIPSGLLVVDETNKITVINNRMCDIFQMGENEISLDNIASRLNKNEENFRFSELLSNNKEIKNFECRLIDCNDQSKYLDLSLVPFVHNEKQNLLVIEDITYRKEAEIKLLQSLQQLEAVNLNKDKLLSIISHDLRSPFTALFGSLNMLQESYDEYSDEERKEFINIAQKVSTNLLSLINDLLEWSKVQNSRLVFNPTQNNLSELINRIVELYSLNTSLKNINLISECDESCKAYFDEDMIFTVIRNLISNAIKFTNKGGTIKINTAEKKDEIILSITDSGIGIPDQILKNLFSLSKEKQRNGTDSESGTGMGLLLCKELVDKNFGRIWVESKVNEGTTFFVSLPKNSIKQLLCA